MKALWLKPAQRNLIENETAWLRHPMANISSCTTQCYLFLLVFHKWQMPSLTILEINIPFNKIFQDWIKKPKINKVSKPEIEICHIHIN